MAFYWSFKGFSMGFVRRCLRYCGGLVARFGRVFTDLPRGIFDALTGLIRR